MPRVATIAHHEESSRPAKRMKLTHRRNRSSISILGSVSNIGTTLAGYASRLFSPVSPPNEQFESKLPAPLAIHTAPWSSSISLLSIMAEEHVNMWEQLECAQDDSHILKSAWMGLQAQTQEHSACADRQEAHDPQSFLDMDSDSESEEDNEYPTTEPTTGHSAFSDWDSDSDTDDSDLMDERPSPATSSSSLLSSSACAASAGHSFWEEDPQSGDEYWDRQTAMLCAKHVHDAFPDAKPRGDVPLERFIADLLRTTRGSVRDDVAFVALQFIRRLGPACPLGYYEDMFFISFMLAAKVEHDCGHSLRWWSKHCSGHWSISELGAMERRILQALDWNLSTSLNCRASYQTYLAGLSSFASA